jgi:peptidoglycan/LPS O-acetylase OafA/YrhL
MDRRANNFDALRLLAAWLVLFSHCYPIVGATRQDPFAQAFGIDTLGGVGLTIFFTLSGYLVTLSFQRSESIAEFTWRRVRRIYPALIVCVLCCAFVLGPIVTTLPLNKYFSHELFAQFLWTATAWEIRFALPGVFESLPTRFSVNGSLWSLPYEIVCYLGVVLIGVLPGRAQLKAAAVVFLLLLVLILRPLTPSFPVFDHYAGLNFYTNKLALQFAIGACVALWPRTGYLDWIGACIASIALIGCLTLPHSVWRLAIYSVSLPIVILAVGLHLSRLPKWPPHLGDWSYGLFLWSFPTQQLIMHSGYASTLGFPGFIVASTFISLGMAASSWFIVERRANLIGLPSMVRRRVTSFRFRR